MRGSENPKNVSHRLIASHLVDGAMIPGEEIAVRIDQTLTQDTTGTFVMLELEAMGLDRLNHDLYQPLLNLGAGGLSPAQIGTSKLAGRIARLLWLGAHLMELVAYANRARVLFEWAFSYPTRRRGALLITGAVDGTLSP